MSVIAGFRRLITAVTATLIASGLATAANATDTYDLATRQLSIPSVTIGSATYTNMVVTVGGIVTPPSGTSPASPQDSYNPVNGELTVPAVTVNGTIYYNAVVTVQSLDSVSSVQGADTYSSSGLSIPSIQVGTTIYTGVVVTVGSIVSQGGGMPNATADSYNPSNGQLTIAAVQVGSRVYTNAVIKVGSIKSVASSYPSVPSADLQALAVAYVSIVGATEVTDLAGIAAGFAPCNSGSESYDSTTNVQSFSACVTAYTPGSTFSGTLTPSLSPGFGILDVASTASLAIICTTPVATSFAVNGSDVTTANLIETLSGTAIQGQASLSALNLYAGNSSEFAYSTFTMRFVRSLQGGTVTTSVSQVDGAIDFDSNISYLLTGLSAIAWQGAGYPSSGSAQIQDTLATVWISIEFQPNGQFTYTDVLHSTQVTKHWTDADVQAAIAFVTH